MQLDGSFFQSTTLETFVSRFFSLQKTLICQIVATTKDSRRSAKTLSAPGLLLHSGRRFGGGDLHGLSLFRFFLRLFNLGLYVGDKRPQMQEFKESTRV